MPKASLRHRLRAIEEDITQLGELVGFCLNTIERLLPLVAELKLNAEGVTLEEFAASYKAAQELPTASGIEEEEDGV